jgi:hypothetical protein
MFVLSVGFVFFVVFFLSFGKEATFKKSHNISRSASRCQLSVISRIFFFSFGWWFEWDQISESMLEK